MKSGHKGLRTWIEIDRKSVASNFAVFRKIAGKKTLVMAVVKSNAYGHGLADFATEIKKVGADWLGVDSVVEGIALRQRGIKLPILILGHTLPERIAEAAENNLSMTVASLPQLEAALTAKTAKTKRLHIKVDTGMHRQGFLLHDEKSLLRKLQAPSSKHQAIIEGLFTHFATAKNPAFPEYTKNQIAEFEIWREAFRKAGFSPICHASATAGALLFPEARYDMVRIGIGLYGLWPSKESRGFLSDKIKLVPALVWKTVIAEVKKLPKGAKIGYDSTETLSKDARVAVIPVGYWHGYPRALSSIGRVLVRGARCKILGRVSMDMISIDVSSAPTAKEGDEVVLIGRSGKEEISAYELADLSDSSWYEIVTRINPLIKRFYR